MKEVRKKSAKKINSYKKEKKIRGKVSRDNY